MLTLLRKYQKSIFLVVTVMVVASFLFFGISNSIHSQVKEKDFKFGTAIDGSVIRGREIKNLSRFMASDITDLLIFERRARPNLLNDGAFKQEILDTGIAHELYVRFEDVLKEEIGEKYQRFRAYIPYEHPQKLIGSIAVWKQYGSEEGLYAKWENFKSLGPEMNETVFDTLLDLYLAQKKLPPGIVRQILLYQQHQYGEMLEKDPYLQSGELALFNAKSSTDWFGGHFLELVATFVHNSSIYAKQLGYQVSYDEAYASMIENAMKGLKQVYQGQNVSKEDFARFIQRQLSELSMSEEEAVKTWQKILVTRRWLNDAGNSVFVDPELYRGYYDFACKSAKIDHYSLPSAVNFKTVDDMLKFELYLTAIGKREKLLDMPSDYFSIKLMKSSMPELLEKRFIVEVTSKEREEIAVGVSLKDSLSWQLDEANWSKLKEKFPLLATYGGNTADEKHEFFDRIDAKERSQIDAFVRSNIIDEHPEMIRETLSQGKASTQLITIPMIKTGTILRNLSDHKTLLHLLETTPLRNERSLGTDIESAIKLSCYSEDQKTFYSIRLIDRDEDFHVMSFERAKKQGVLDKLLGEALRKEYADGRYREEYDEVLSKLKLARFEYIIKEIEKNEAKDEKEFDTLEKRLNFARQYRMASYMRERLQEAKEGNYIPETVDQNLMAKDVLSPVKPLSQSWYPVCEEETISRNLSHPSFDDAMFEMCAMTWSDVKVEFGDGPYFYHVLDSYIDSAPIARRLVSGRETLSSEARSIMLREFLDSAVEKGAVSILVKEENTES